MSTETLPDKTYPSTHGRFIYRAAVLSLGTVAIVSVFGVVWLANDGIEKVPDALIALGSGAIGALSSVLVDKG